MPGMKANDIQTNQRQINPLKHTPLSDCTTNLAQIPLTNTITALYQSKKLYQPQITYDIDHQFPIHTRLLTGLRI